MDLFWTIAVLTVASRNIFALEAYRARGGLETLAVRLMRLPAPSVPFRS